MLGVSIEHIVDPLSATQREPAPEMPTGQLQAEPVPAAHKPQPMPLVRIIMPLVMVVAMVGMVVLLVLGAGPGRTVSPMMLMFPLMMVMSMAAMFGPGNGGEDKDDVRRSYLRHLHLLREEALANAAEQRAAEWFRHPDPAGVHAWVGTPRLWERQATDPDALEVRIGVGSAALCTPIDVPDPGAAEELDPVCAVSLRRLIAAVGTVPNIPVVVQLQAFRFLGIAGPTARGLVRSMLHALLIAHGPEVVGLHVIGRSAADHREVAEGAKASGWEWMKWVPHVRNPRDAAFRILVVDSIPTTGLEEFIDSEEWTTIIDVGSQRLTALGYRAEHEGLRLWAGEELKVVTAAGEETLGQCDAVALAEMEIYARQLAKFRRPHNGAGHDSTTGGDPLGLLGYASVDELVPERMWPGHDGQKSRLVVPIGVDPAGQPVRLDFKEPAHGGMGPHGLCLGATGSGKSELLKTVVTALAATHSPNELNLVLVDFKGGATFLECEKLPHTAAVITNLEDEAVLVDRMFDAISGEMQRRQQVLREAGNFANVTDYTAARNKQIAEHGSSSMAPLPALLIIVDEFSELLGQHPDFAELFVAVGRLGRSLHVHLLLASQRLEEGRLRGLDSHLSYRLGLKTFSAGESRQVLGVPDAYHLPSQPGAGYLKTDADALERFQASYVSGAAMRPVRASDLDATGLGEPASRPALQIFEEWTQETSESDAALGAAAGSQGAGVAMVADESTTVMEAVVEAAAETAELRGESAHPIWLPPLPAEVSLAGVAEDHGFLQAAIGIIDRPFQQRQDPFIVDFGAEGGHLALCGAPQMGKSTALRTIVTSLAATHKPGDVRFYVLDLGGGQLQGLDLLPHVAGVAQSNDPEKVNRVVDEVAGLVAQPERRHTFLIIDGWHHIGASNAEYENLEDAIGSIVVDGPSANVHVVLATGRWTTIRPAIRDHIATRVELRLAEALDSLIERKRQEKLPALPGRGLTPGGELMLLAHSGNQDAAHIATVAQQQGLEPVPQLKMLPEEIHLDELGEASGLAFAHGGRDMTTVAWDPVRDSHVVCVGSGESGKSTWVRTIAAGITQLGRAAARMVVIDHRRAHLGELDEDMVAVYSASGEATEKALRSAHATLSARLPGEDVTPAELKARSWWEGPEIYIVIDDVELVSDGALDLLQELLPHSRDIGMHLVLARKAGGIGRAMYQRFYSALRDTQPAVLLLDADRDEGAIFGMKPTPQPPGRGRWHTRNAAPSLVQVAHTNNEQ
ncbi:type VII secretion protein EccCa [Corynebacterium incognita]|uniref:Type VII secretion protein EccCa n=1 Tax=Corynebacterium incognita TaxID=2754725 RepID=A0A7G7CMY7_9CORY|nr:type VII secretion protein EccCa [Corynebacterium incognita]QNE88953.1 type VII secretion protein EccCa [Corynebacterium incognita]